MTMLRRALHSRLRSQWLNHFGPTSPKSVGSDRGDLSVWALFVVVILTFVVSCNVESPEDTGSRNLVTSTVPLSAAPAVILTSAPPRAAVMSTPTALGVISTTAAPLVISTPAPAADRTDCDAIRGTEYRSTTERDWFRSNCDTAPTIPRPSDSSQPTVIDPGGSLAVGNLAPNASFEAGTSAPTGWQFIPNRGTGAWDAAVARSGSRSVSLSSDVSVQPQFGYCTPITGGIWRSEFISIDSAHGYVLSAWHKASRLGNVTTIAYLRIFYFDSDGREVRTVLAPNYPYDELEDRAGANTLDWRNVTLSARPPADATKVRLALYPAAVVTSGSCSTGSVFGWYDDVSFTQVP